jgi:hypothetical protein
VLQSGILSFENVQNELISHLPIEQQNVQSLEQTIRSPQFQQAVGSLDQALAQDYNSLMSNFDINPSPGMDRLLRGDTVGAFLTSLSSANPPPPSPSLEEGAGGSSSSDPKEDQKEEKEDEEKRMEE